MRTLAIATLTLLVALPIFGQDEHQSYITYDDGDSVLVQSDGRQVDARINLPIYPGDQLVAGARGRSEVRLADGNVLAIDRYTRLTFESLLWSFESSDKQTVVRLNEGQVVLYRLYRGSEALRLDTSNASYLAAKESLYGVEVNSKGVDLVTVFDGEIEVRTRDGAVVLGAGDTAKIDLTGIYSRNRLVSDGATEFEQWFIRRANRYSAGESRYLDSSLAYVEAELSENGEWVYLSGSGYVWKPYVSVGWRPYYNGYWYAGWGGTVAWVSYEPWGWYPYHYGRWGYNSYHGWVWYPGYGYSPAWVYWTWGPTWVGWVPAGWYDCYWGWNSWYYYPHYSNCYNCGYYNGYSRGYGFNGRVTISSGDLSAYTIVDRGVLFSNRVDRASLTADQVKQRLSRDGNTAVLSNRGVRVTNDELRDPSRVADRIIRGVDGSGTGTSQGTGSPSDVTQFFRRDPNPSADVRDRVTRGVTRDGATTTATRGTAGGATAPSDTAGASGTVTRGTTGARGGAVTRPTAGTSGGTVTRPTPSTGGTVTRPTPSTGGAVSRPTPSSGTPSSGGATPQGTVRPRTNSPDPGTVDRGGSEEARPRTATRPAGQATNTGGGSEGTTSRPRTVTRPTPASPTETRETPKTDSGTRSEGEKPTRAAPKEEKPVSRPPTRSDSTSASDDWRRGGAGSSDPAQRVITTIGGARISSSSSDRSGDTTQSTTRSGESSSDSWRNRGSFTTGSSDRGTATRSGSSSTTRGSSGVSRPSSGSKPSGGTTSTRSGSGSSSGSSPSTRSSGSSSSGGGKAGMSRPSSGGSNSGGSKSGGSTSSGSRSSGSSSGSSSGKVTRDPK